MTDPARADTTSSGRGPAVLHLSTHHEPGGVLLELTGELDIATAGQLASCTSVELPPGGLLRVDLGGLDFIDLTGLRAVLAAHTATQARGCRLRVCRPRPLTRRMFAITGLDAVLDIEPAADPHTGST